MEHNIMGTQCSESNVKHSPSSLTLHANKVSHEEYLTSAGGEGVQ